MRKRYRYKSRHHPLCTLEADNGKLNMTWEHVITKNPDTSKIGEMPGLQVVSPTWFSVADSEGRIK